MNSGQRSTGPAGGSAVTAETGSEFSTRRDGGSRSNQHGVAYQVKVHMLTALRGLRYNYKISYEEAGLETLDDLCFRYDDGIQKMIVLQAKHTRKEGKEINEKALFAECDDFSLANHFLSYCKTRRKALAEDTEVEVVVLYTNMPLDTAVIVEPTELKGAVKELFMNESWREGMFVKLIGQKAKTWELVSKHLQEKTQAVREKPTPEIEEWCRQNGYELPKPKQGQNSSREKRKREIIDWCKEKGLDLKELWSEFIDRLILAVKQPPEQEMDALIIKEMAFHEGTPEESKINAQRFYKFMTDIMNDSRQKMPFLTPDGIKRYLLEVKLELLSCQHKARRALRNLHRLRFCERKLIHHPEPGSRWSLQVIHTDQPHACTHLVEQSLKAAPAEWPGTHILVDADDFQLALQQLRHVGPAALPCSVLVLIHASDSSLADLCRSIHDLPLPDEPLCIVVLTKSPPGQQAQSIGSSRRLLDVFVNIVAEDLTKECLEELLAIPVEFQVPQTGSGPRDMTMGDVVGDVSCMRDVLDSVTVETIAAGGPIVIGRGPPTTPKGYQNRHLTSMKGKTQSEDTIVKKSLSGQRHVIICAPPGAGKSTLASSMCRKFKALRPNHWVGVCNLKNHSNVFKNMPVELNADYFEVLCRLLSVTVELERNLLRKRLRTGNVTIMFDSYDEIEHLYSRQFLDLLKVVSENHLVNVWVLTRPHTVESSESALKGAEMYDLLLLRSSEQIAMIRGLLGISILEEDILSKDPDFYAFPQHIKMIADLSKRDGAKISHISKYSLYDKFVELKLDEAYGTASETRSALLTIDKKAKDRKTFENLACVELLDAADRQKLGVGFNSNKLACLLQHHKSYNVGLLRSMHPGDFEFVHQTYAEFFFSLFLYSRLGDIPETIWKRVMTSDWFAQVREFLDGRLSLNPIQPSANISPLKEPVYYSRSFKHAKSIAAICPMARSTPLGVSVCELLPALSNYHCNRSYVNLSSLEKQSVLLAAAFSKSVSVVENIAMTDVPTVLAARGEGGETALHLACMDARHYRPEDTAGSAERNSGAPYVVRILIRAGCSAHARTKYGATAVHITAESGTLPVLEALLESQPAERELRLFRYKDSIGCRALDIAVDNVDVFNFLLERERNLAFLA